MCWVEVSVASVVVASVVVVSILENVVVVSMMVVVVVVVVEMVVEMARVHLVVSVVLLVVGVSSDGACGGSARWSRGRVWWWCLRGLCAMILWVSDGAAQFRWIFIKFPLSFDDWFIDFDDLILILYIGFNC
jgi:hypothetical protein